MSELEEQLLGVWRRWPHDHERDGRVNAFRELGLTEVRARAGREPALDPPGCVGARSGDRRACAAAQGLEGEAGRMKRLRGVVGIAAAGIVLAGCGDAGSETQATATPSELGSVGTVAELKNAAVAAGYACPSWEQDNVVTLAAESGHCTDSDVFTTYLSESAREEAVRGLKQMAKDTRELFEGEDVDPALTDEEVLLVGPNWIINSIEAPELQDELGGQVVRY